MQIKKIISEILPIQENTTHVNTLVSIHSLGLSSSRFLGGERDVEEKRFSNLPEV